MTSTMRAEPRQSFRPYGPEMEFLVLGPVAHHVDDVVGVSVDKTKANNAGHFRREPGPADSVRAHVFPVSCTRRSERTLRPKNRSTLCHRLPAHQLARSSFSWTLDSDWGIFSIYGRMMW